MLDHGVRGHFRVVTRIRTHTHMHTQIHPHPHHVTLGFIGTFRSWTHNASLSQAIASVFAIQSSTRYYKHPNLSVTGYMSTDRDTWFFECTIYLAEALMLLLMPFLQFVVKFDVACSTVRISSNTDLDPRWCIIDVCPAKVFVGCW
jgi:hypothetical protein